MGANNADFQHHILVHRGVPDTSVDQLLSSPRGLGIHWSAELNVARKFVNLSSEKGAVVSGLVHPDDLMTKEEIEEHNRKFPTRHIYGYNDNVMLPEKEVPVRRGATVHILMGQDVKFGDEFEIKNHKQFDTPKEAKA